VSDFSAGSRSSLKVTALVPAVVTLTVLVARVGDRPPAEFEALLSAETSRE
jgi:hypothetical protein